MSYHDDKPKFTTTYIVTIKHDLPLASMLNHVENRLVGMNCEVRDVTAVLQTFIPKPEGNITVPAQAQSSHIVEGHDPETCEYCLAIKAGAEASLAKAILHVG